MKSICLFCETYILIVNCSYTAMGYAMGSSSKKIHKKGITQSRGAQFSIKNCYVFLYICKKCGRNVQIVQGMEIKYL